jgi:hypothetical protein
MTDKTLTIHHAGDGAARLAELLRELSAEQLDAADLAIAEERTWRHATRAVELCWRAAELAARR